MMILNKPKTLNTLYDIEDEFIASVNCNATCEACEHQQLCDFIAALIDEITYSKD